MLNQREWHLHIRTMHFGSRRKEMRVYTDPNPSFLISGSLFGYSAASRCMHTDPTNYLHNRDNMYLVVD
jgi:hypothetical protein